LLNGSEKNRLLNGVKNGLADVKGTVRNDHRLPERVIQKYTQCIGYIIYVISVEKFKEPKAEVK